MLEPEWITARRNELDTLAEELAQQLTEVQAEREELVIAERVLHRLAEQDWAVAAAPPADYRKILAIVRAADGPVQVRAVGEELGLEVTAHGKLEPLRAKMTKLGAAGLGAIADYKAARNRPPTRGQKLSNTALAAVRAPVEHGFAHLENRRALVKVRTDPTWATTLVRALLVLTNREVSR
ncbi:hypothetical protein [Streptomyces hokutonensis]|uniref:hypothetical protein n=1 Tax=Streptomyces hokutonensis TaxID=1306990 RepID=UPI00369544C6